QNHPVKYSFSSEDLKLWYNPQLLEKVFYNVLMNAFKYADENTTIFIDTDIISMEGSDYSDKVDRNFNEAFVISIFNKGDNLPEDKLEKIFEPFYRLKNTHSTHSSGIGLSLNKMIMKLHHGDIWAENVDGEGLSFKILLPVGSEHLQENELTPVEPETGIEFADNEKKYTILLVEDNSEIRYYLKSRLSNLYQVYDCDNGYDALKVLRKKDIS